MSEDRFDEILGMALMRETAELDNSVEHKFSLKHRLAMKRVFARYERNVRELSEDIARTETPRLSFKQRLIIALIIVFLLTVTGCGIVKFISKDFHGDVYKEATRVYAVNLENALSVIEYEYCLKTVPEGFELVDTDTSSIHSYLLYMNTATKQTISLRQWVKPHYKPHLNTEYNALEEVNINDTTGLCIELGSESQPHTILLWDNGDYIIEILADLDKSDTLNLSKSTNLQITE